MNTKRLKVALFTYPSAFQNVGGGEILLLKTKKYLEAAGVEVELFDMWRTDLANFNILHVMTSVKDCLGLVATAKSKGVKVVVSPVFFSTLQRALHEYGGCKQKVLACLRHATKVIFPHFPSARRKMMTLADAVIPNSHVELNQLSRLFAVSREKMYIVPNCVDERFAHANKNVFIDKWGFKNFILSVGRIEPRKNQLNLIRAMKSYSARLVLIGDPVSDYSDYYQACRTAAGENVTFIEKIDHDEDMLEAAYAACQCLVSPGWFETPGLTALEGGLAGANVAITDRGCTREYFQDFVEYLDPSDVKSIRRATEAAFTKEKTSLLKERIRDNFLWDVAARKNIEVYRKILGRD